MRGPIKDANAERGAERPRSTGTAGLVRAGSSPPSTPRCEPLPQSPDRYHARVRKRGAMPILLQRVAGLLGSIATLPMLVGIVTAVRIDSPGPGFHGARRVGGGGQLFTCYKIRTMYIASDGSGPAGSTTGGWPLTRVRPSPRPYDHDTVLLAFERR